MSDGGFFHYLQVHHTQDALIAYWLLSAAIGALPMPDDKSSKFYDWLFKFANTVGANLSRVNASFGSRQQPPTTGGPKP